MSDIKIIYNLQSGHNQTLKSHIDLVLDDSLILVNWF